MTIDDIGAFEVNEAFPRLRCSRGWPRPGQIRSGSTTAGGCIAVRAPCRRLGAILMTRMLAQLRRANPRYRLPTTCEAAARPTRPSHRPAELTSLSLPGQISGTRHSAGPSTSIGPRCPA
ncbi:hypothetical protein EEB14_52890 [Rhodococcus sp. WS4]|nr:hypothetical protein EEB14_52890 [Rhodococcus sp. WS4]